MKTRKLPSPRVLRRLLEYIPETGELRWKERPAWMFPRGRYNRKLTAAWWNKRYAGKDALTAANQFGYLNGSIFNKNIRSHRAIWALVHGAWPTGQIDHENGDRQDNRLQNLREVTPKENSRNQKLRKSNSSGVMGVFLHRPTDKWYAYIGGGKKRVFLGSFSNYSDAVAARKQAEIKHNFHPNHGRST